MLIINDTHFSFNRKAGVTPASQLALRVYQYETIKGLLSESKDEHVLVLGDLFDGFLVDNRDLLDVFNLLTEQVTGRGRFLTLVAGNHDISSRGEKVSSFSVLCQMLSAVAPQLVGVVDINETEVVAENVLAIAHHSNQDLFNQALESTLVKDPDGLLILLHANFHNEFAAESDHSLNVSRDMAVRFKHAGATLVFAHEHQARTALGGAVVVLGNQVCTSVSDCLGNDSKFAHILVGGQITKVPTWTRDDPIAPFHEVDWRELAEQDGFVRVTGQASSTEASEVISAIAKFRSKSAAFVVTNSVKIDGISECEALPSNFEAIKKFDVMEFIRKNLDADEMVVVEGLMEGGE